MCNYDDLKDDEEQKQIYKDNAIATGYKEPELEIAKGSFNISALLAVVVLISVFALIALWSVVIFIEPV